MANILIVGSSGHAASVIDIAEQIGSIRIIGLLDRFNTTGSRFHGYEILGGEENIRELCSDRKIDGVAVAIGDNWGRSQSVATLQALAPDLQFVTLIHPSATVSPSAVVGRGTVVMAGAIVNANCRIGDFCILNTKASLDHDCVVEDFASLAPGVTSGGRVTVGMFSALCLGANVIHKCRIGQHTVLGAGSTLLSDLPDQVIAYGVPAKVVRNREIGESYL